MAKAILSENISLNPFNLSDNSTSKLGNIIYDNDDMLCSS